MKRPLSMLVLACSVTGCASQLGAFFNRPVVEDHIDKKMTTVSLSADRRTIIVPHMTTPGEMIFCAEPPPDTATALKTDFDASLKVKGDEASVKDKFDTAVTVLSARNAPLDAFRTGVFTLCQFYVIGAIDKAQVPGLFEKLIASYEKNQAAVPAIVKDLTQPPDKPAAPGK